MTKVVPIRIPADVLEWIDGRCADSGKTRTAVILEAVRFARSGRRGDVESAKTAARPDSEAERIAKAGPIPFDVPGAGAAAEPVAVEVEPEHDVTMCQLQDCAACRRINEARQARYRRRS